jgi:hypothetical protein
MKACELGSYGVQGSHRRRGWHVSSTQRTLLLILFVTCRVMPVAAHHHEDSDGHFECSQDSDCHNGGTCVKSDSTEGELHNTESGSEGGYCKCKQGFMSNPDCAGDYCPLVCKNGGTCRLADGEDFSEPHCDCRTPWQGDLCEIPYVTCPDQTTKCINGAICEVAEADEGDDKTLYNCVCNPNNPDSVFCQELQAAGGSNTSNAAGGGGDKISVEAKSLLIVGFIFAAIVAAFVATISQRRRRRGKRQAMADVTQNNELAVVESDENGDSVARDGSGQPNKAEII